jgi:hypothetical protein
MTCAPTVRERLQRALESARHAIEEALAVHADGVRR